MPMRWKSAAGASPGRSRTTFRYLRLRPVEPVLGNGHVLTACVDRELAETASTGRYRGGVVKSAVSTHRPDVLDTRAAQSVIAFKRASRPTEAYL